AGARERGRKQRGRTGAQRTHHGGGAGPPGTGKTTRARGGAKSEGGRGGGKRENSREGQRADRSGQHSGETEA
ncbi:type VII secretion AAA-ATPase EccA, partial [Mycobacterium tuberculosis]